jgi:hypothetical protein
VPYGQGVPSVEPTPTAPEDYERVAPTGLEAYKELGQSIKGLGAEIGKSAEFFGQVRADNAFNNYQEQSTKLLYGDPSKKVPGPDGSLIPDTGFMGLRGDVALRQRPQVEQQLDNILKQSRAGLSTPREQLEFDTYSRRLRTNLGERIGSHADEQAKTYYAAVNKQTDTNAQNMIGADPLNEDSFNHSMHDAINARVKQAQLEGAQPGDVLWKQAVNDGTRASWTTRIEAAAARDPATAYKMLQENQSVLGVNYDPLAAKIRPLVADKVLNDRVYKNVQPPAAAGAPAGRPALRLVPPAAAAAPVAGLETSKLSPQYNESIAKHAQDIGAKPADLYAAINYESRFNMNIRGGTGGNYFGLIQFGPKESRQFGVHPGMTFDQQMDSVNKFLVSRGFKPGMGIAEMYSIINAGSLDANGKPRWSASDGRGTIATHVGEIQKNFYPGGAAHVTEATLGPADQKMAIAARGVDTGAPGTVLSKGQVMSDALAFFPDDPEMQRLYISRGDALANEIKTSSALDATEIKQKSDAAANGYMTAILGGTAQPNILGQIANDPNMTWETKESLTRAIESHADDSNVNATASYGTGFWDAYKAVNAPVGDPSRIADIATIFNRAGPGGNLTLAGAQKLATLVNANRKSVDDAAVNRTKLGLLDYAKDKLSFDQDTMVPGAPPLKDPRGRQIFEGTFIPQFEAAYDKWTKEGKDPWQFLTKDNVEKLIGGLRSPREMALAKMQAAEGTVPQGTQLPSPPEGVDPQGWREVMSVPVVVAGAALPLDKWQATIERLAADPTETNKAWFDYHFGPSFTAAFGDQKDRASDVVLDALGISGKQALPPDERPSTGKPAAAAAPSAPAAPGVAAAGEAAGAPPTIFNPLSAAIEGLGGASRERAAAGSRALETPGIGPPTLPPPVPGEPLTAFSPPGGPIPDVLTTMVNHYRQTLKESGKFTAKEIDQMVSDHIDFLRKQPAPAAPEKPSPPYFGGMVRG